MAALKRLRTNDLTDFAIVLGTWDGLIPMGVLVEWLGRWGV